MYEILYYMYKDGFELSNEKPHQLIVDRFTFNDLILNYFKLLYNKM